MKNEKLLFGIIFVLLSALCSSVGQLVWKLMTLNNLPPYYYLIGLCLYGFGALLLILSFKFGEMSVLHPMLSFGFVLAVFWSVNILGEQITIQKIAGTALIIAGVVFLALGNSKSEQRMDSDGITS